MRVECDFEADAVYVYVNPVTAGDDRIQSTTRWVSDDVAFDLDQHGELIGVEILGPRNDVAGRCGAGKVTSVILPADPIREPERD